MKATAKTLTEQLKTRVFSPLIDRKEELRKIENAMKKDMMKKISVIVPVYNQLQYLDECLMSILHQSYKGEIEIIVVNDGSTDGTKEFLELIKDQYNLKVIQYTHNCGLAEALNTGMDNCSGDYISWISSDCYFEPNALEVLAQSLEDNPDCGLISSGFHIFGDRESIEQHKARKYTIEDLKNGNFVGMCFLFRYECFHKVGYFNADLPCTEDWDYWARISIYYPLLKINGVYGHWRSHSKNLTTVDGPTIGFINSARIREKYKNTKCKY